MLHTVSSNPELVKAGYLTKSPPGDAPPISKWRRRWFVLCDSLRAYPLAERYVRLEYYQNEGEARRLSDPKGVINLIDCTRVSGVARVKGHNYVFDVITRERTYHIAAETPTEKHEWIQTINSLLFTNGQTLPQVNETTDLERAELQRKKSMTKPSSRQISLEDLNKEKQRPTSCVVNMLDDHNPPILPKRPEKLEVISQVPTPTPRKIVAPPKRRPLPPTPDDENIIVPVPKSRPKSSLECIRGNNDSPNLPTRIIHTPPIHSNDSAQFDYEDINYDYDEVPDDTIENDEHYDDPTDLNEPPCDYEVPSQTKPVLAPTISVPITNLIPTAKPVPTNKPVPAKRSNGRNVTSAPVLSSPCDDKPPPVPPPRNRSSRTKDLLPDNNLHGSLPNINDEEYYSELQHTEFGLIDDEGAYSKLMKIAPIRERRFSDPEIILLSPTSPPPSSLFSSVTNKLDLPPPTPPRLSNGPSPNKQKRYYENTGFVPASYQSEEQQYSLLSHIF